MPVPRNLQHHLLPMLLVACYLLGWLVPGPGRWLHGLSPATRESMTLVPTSSQVMVAILLFVAAMAVEWRQLIDVARRPLTLVLSLLAVWLVPGLVARASAAVLPQLLAADVAGPLVVGFLVVAAMPVANSAAGWTQHSEGNVPMTLSLVVLSIVVCPWVAPIVLEWQGLSLDEHQSELLTSVTQQMTGLSFIFWVLLPTGLGFALRRISGADSVDRAKTSRLLVSGGALLMLNYMNASIALPKITASVGWAEVVATVTVSGALCVAGYLTVGSVSRLLGLDRPTFRAIGYSLGMKHTGLALAVASVALNAEHRLLLPIFCTTLVQHVLAAGYHAGQQFPARALQGAD